MINANLDMNKGQGLVKGQLYEGQVVDNADPRNLGRVRVKVATLFEGIDPEHLPWAIPDYSIHPDGASSESGFFAVPKVGSKVLVTFQDGSIFNPIYKGYSIDDKTLLEESKHNYPDRVVALFKNKVLFVIDTKSNELFLRNSGDMHVYIQGNVNLQVDGNVLEKVKGNRTSYVKGNSISVVDGNSTEIVKGNKSTLVQGAAKEQVTGAWSVKAGSCLTSASGDNVTVASGRAARVAARIDDNGVGAPTAPTVSAVTVPAVPKWKGIRDPLPKD